MRRTPVTDQRAEFYKAHRDDESIWEDVEAPQQPNRALGVTLTVRFAADDAELIRSMAKRLGVGYSEGVRTAVSRFVRPTFMFDAQQANATLNVATPVTHAGASQFTPRTPPDAA